MTDRLEEIKATFARSKAVLAQRGDPTVPACDISWLIFQAERVQELERAATTGDELLQSQAKRIEELEAAEDRRATFRRMINGPPSSVLARGGGKRMIRIPASDGEVQVTAHYNFLSPPSITLRYRDGLAYISVSAELIAKLRASKHKLYGKTLMERASDVCSMR